MTRRLTVQCRGPTGHQEMYDQSAKKKVATKTQAGGSFTFH